MTEVITYPPYLYAAECIVKDFTYGDLISKEYLEEKLGLKEPTGSIIEYKDWKVKKLGATVALRGVLLKEHRMYLTAESGGYRICLPKEQTVSVVGKMSKSLLKSMRDAGRGLKNIETPMLNSDQIKENTRAIQVLSSMGQAMKVEKKKFLFLE